MRQPPGEELVVRQMRCKREDGGGQQQSDRHAHLRQRAIETALVGRRGFDHHQHRAAPFPADAETLEKPHQNQERGRPDADLIVGRQDANHERRDAHDHQRRDQGRLAADAIAEMTEHDRAERP